MIYLCIYLTIGAIYAIPFSTGLRAALPSKAEYVSALAITIVSWPVVIVLSLAYVYFHWDDVE